MTPKQITTLAHHRLVPPWVMRLALDVAAAERDRCAKLCDDMSKTEANMNKTWRNGCSDSAEAIRSLK